MVPNCRAYDPAFACELVVIVDHELLAKDWSVTSDLFSVTSFSELARDARNVERWNRLHPEQEARRSHVDTLLEGSAPVVAATD